MNDKSCEYGVGDNSYIMAGELSGITQLVDDFYKHMNALSECKKIREMHSNDLTEKINIPFAHKHLRIGKAESDAWLFCMQKAVDMQNYEEAFKDYLMNQIRVPAERILMVSNV